MYSKRPTALNNKPILKILKIIKYVLKIFATFDYCLCYIVVMQIYKRAGSNTQTHRWKQMHRQLRCSGMNRLLISDFGSSTRGERQFLRVFLNTSSLVGPQTLNTMVGTQFLNNIFQWPKSNPIPQWQELNYRLTRSNLKSQLPGRTPTSQHKIGPNLNCLPLR